MDSSGRCTSHRPLCPQHHHHHHHFHYPLFHCNHHHHRHHLLPNCPLHGFSFHPNSHSHIYPRFTPPPPQNPEPSASVSAPNGSNLKFSDRNNTYDSDSVSRQEGHEVLDSEEEEFAFVLTDEWKEFFAKSEAKRKLARQQASKKGATSST